MLWPKNLSKKIKTKVNLADFTSFKIGGRAEYFFEPQNLKCLQQALISAQQAGLRVFILGSGSNILVSDSGLAGLVIKLNHRNFKRIYCQDSCIIAGSGLKLSQLISFAAKRGLSGVEFLAGIPGSLGGSLMGNAGAWGNSIGALVKQLGVLDYNGKLKNLTAHQLKFGYRKSNLNKYIIIWAKLKLSAENKKVIASRVKEYLLKRKAAWQNSLPSAGCIFKNPGLDPAGRLIELCGLKGQAKGNAIICGQHANFILNTGGAGSRDVLFLMDLMQRKVKAKFKVNLEPEIKIWK
ncbi:MAG: UDP-N-acetylenolpyruvoylglucosamine reductase [Candidatus Omnitrophica bacterium CG11_big_fil_rev_8_21_14_0_20_43_6]|nr:MAG: UDP-N-acetylenolpyruvoylglucosamine reductase [Candidatus Omnitrophica bacterium CG11_big_fil_rev_8_21_14_0_20_43_6]